MPAWPERSSPLASHTGPHRISSLWSSRKGHSTEPAANTWQASVGMDDEETDTTFSPSKIRETQQLGSCVTWWVFYIHELDVFGEVVQQGLTILFPIDVQGIWKREGYLSVHCRLCSRRGPCQQKEDGEKRSVKISTVTILHFQTYTFQLCTSMQNSRGNNRKNTNQVSLKASLQKRKPETHQWLCRALALCSWGEWPESEECWRCWHSGQTWNPHGPPCRP